MWPGLLKELRRVLREFNPDLVHAGPVPSCGFLAALAGAKPLVAMSWGSDVLIEAERNPVVRWITRYTLQHADVIVGDCRAVREKIRALAEVSDERIVTYPWGIDLHLFGPRRSNLNLRESLGWTRARVFLSCRSWEPPYHIDVLVAAFHKVAREAETARLLLLGDGSMAPQIKKMIDKGGYRDRIYMAGQIPQSSLPDYYNLADVYVSSVPSDGTSISLLEAMACGLPVIVADAPGNREWVVPEANGWLFQPGNPDSLADAMKSAVQPAGSDVRMREANIELARQKADWNKNFQVLLSAYTAALQSGRSCALELAG
jgi:glycosyltransferase involved in cell wall biosynthesis